MTRTKLVHKNQTFYLDLIPDSNGAWNVYQANGDGEDKFLGRRNRIYAARRLATSVGNGNAATPERDSCAECYNVDERPGPWHDDDCKQYIPF